MEPKKEQKTPKDRVKAAAKKVTALKDGLAGSRPSSEGKRIVGTRVESELAKKKDNKQNVDAKKRKGRTHSGKRAATIVMNPEIRRSVKEPLREAVVVWGRMNPPTVGHERLINEAIAMAELRESDAVVFLSRTSTGERNPLPHHTRIELVEKVADGRAVVRRDALANPIDVLAALSEDYDSVVVVTGEEHVDDYVRFFEDYNGDLFDLEEMYIRPLKRDENSALISESISATDMRALAMADDMIAFTEGLPAALQEQGPMLAGLVKQCTLLNEGADQSNMLSKVVKNLLV